MASLQRIDVDGVTVLRLAGALDRIEVGGVERAFRDAARRHHHHGAGFVIDLAAVDFLATPAIAMFVDAARSLRRAGARVAVGGAQPRVAEVLHRLRLEAILSIEDSVDDAVERVRESGREAATPAPH